MSTSSITQAELSGQTGLLQSLRSIDVYKSVLLPLLMLLTVLSAVAPSVAGWLIVACFAAALLAASWIDTRTRLIPNRLTYPLFLFGISVNLIVSVLCDRTVIGAVGIQESLTGAAMCFGLMLMMFVSNATGGGDVKLATVIGAFLGPQASLTAIAWCHVLAGVVVLFWLVSRLDAVQLFRDARNYCTTCLIAGRLQPINCNLNAVGQRRIPMAAFFTLGVVVTQLGYRLW